MSADRMRRVDEAIRQVIGDAVACDLKDPRVGFVTVTDVRTSADLSHARVYVSVLGERGAARGDAGGLRSAHGYLQGRIAGELHLKRTPTLEFSYDDTTDRAMRLDALIERRERPASTHERESIGSIAHARSGARADRARRAVRGGHAREPRRRRARLAARRCTVCSPRSARTRRCSSRRATCRSRASTAAPRSSTRFRPHPADIGERTVVMLDCGNIDRNPARGAAARSAPTEHRPPPRQHLFGTLNSWSRRASCTAEIVWDLMHGLAVAPTAAIAEALYVGLDNRHGPLHVREHRPRAHRWRPS